MNDVKRWEAAALNDPRFNAKLVRLLARHFGYSPTQSYAASQADLALALHLSRSVVADGLRRLVDTGHLEARRAPPGSHSPVTYSPRLPATPGEHERAAADLGL